MKFLREDNGNCRVYYTTPARLIYCWQNEGRQGWHFYRCSRNGEPDYPVLSVNGLNPRDVAPPPGETDIGRELIAFLST